MRGPSPNFIPSLDQIERLVKFNKTRVFSQSDRDLLSKASGFTVYVYDLSGCLIKTDPSVSSLKKAYNIKLHHKTLYKRISQNKVFNGNILSFVA